MTRFTVDEMANLNEVSAEEFASWYEMTAEEIEWVYLSDDEECPFVGIENKNKEIWVFGCRYDRKVDFETMVNLLHSN